MAPRGFDTEQKTAKRLISLATRYQQAGKRQHLRHLSPDSLEVLDKAKDIIELNVQEDPHYHIADNKLG